MNDLLDTDAQAAGWTISLLWAINDNGVIVANGYRSGFGGLVLLLPTPAVQLITPSGDPVFAPVNNPPAPCGSPTPTPVDGQNEFTFDDCNPGVLRVHLKAKVLATGTAGSLASRCRFTVDPIPGSTMAWASNNPGGQPTNTSGDDLEADVTFTGLPSTNSGFGRKNVTITVDGQVKDQKAMEVFFKRDLKNHPGVDNNITPNWYYYWLQTVQLLGPNPRVFYYTSGPNKYDQQTNEIRIVDGVTPYTAPYGPNNPLEGIDHFGWVLVHESQHYEDWSTFWDIDNSGITKWQAAALQTGPDDDRDIEGLPNRIEDVNLNGIYDTPDLYDWEVYNTPTPGRPPNIVHDGEDFNCQRHKDAKGDHSKDGADPGMQHNTLDVYND